MKLTKNELMENYEPNELLEAFFLHEAKFRLKNFFDLSEKEIEENYESVASILDDNSENILKGDTMDSIIEDYLTDMNQIEDGFEEEDYE